MNIYWKSIYEMHGNNEGAWISKAEQLLAASELLCLQGPLSSMREPPPSGDWSEVIPQALVGQPFESPDDLTWRGMALECWDKGLWKRDTSRGLLEH
jgi:hypothetical protein